MSQFSRMNTNNNTDAKTCFMYDNANNILTLSTHVSIYNEGTH